MPEEADQPAPPDRGGSGGSSGLAEASRPWRYVAVMSVLLGSVALLQWGPPYCRDVIAHNQVARLCAPPGLTDLPTVLVLGLIAALLLPDLSELELAGVVKLKRQLARAEARTAEVAAEVASLRATAAAAATSTALSAPVTNVNIHNSRQVGASETLTGGRVVVSPSAQLAFQSREAGQDAAVAFDAVMLGLRATVIEELGWGEIALIGLTLDDNGQPQVTHVAGDEIPADGVDAVQRVVTTRVTQVARIGPYLLVTSPAVAAEVGLVGVLAAVNEAGEIEHGAEQMREVAQTMAAAAGAYGQALHRLLGELPTLDGPEEEWHNGSDG